MKTLTLETEVQPNGLLRFDVPTNLPPGKVEIVLVIQPQTVAQPPYPNLEGRWRGLVSPDFDLDGFLHEIRHAWEEEWNEPVSVDDLRLLDQLIAIPELHDRLISATGVRLGVPVVTKDATIRACAAVESIW